MLLKELRKKSNELTLAADVSEDLVVEALCLMRQDVGRSSL